MRGEGASTTLEVMPGELVPIIFDRPDTWTFDVGSSLLPTGTEGKNREQGPSV